MNVMDKLIIVVCGATLAVHSAFGDIICSGMTSNVMIDTGIVEATPALDADAILVSWDATWIGGDTNAAVVIADNGAELRRVMGAGDFELMLSGSCRHELTYTTYIDGIVQDEVYRATVYSRWKYDVIDGGVVIIATTQTSGVVTIPSEIDGLPVIGVGNDAFKDCVGLTSVAIPDCVRNIGAGAFSGCSGLESVVMPGRFDGNLDSSVFAGCSSGLVVSYNYAYLDVAFDANGGVVGEQSLAVAEGAEIGGLPTPTLIGHSFDGWYTDRIGGTKITESSKVWESFTCYAHWRVCSYTMTFDANGGVGGTSVTQDYDTALFLPEVVRTGYTFNGWSPSVPSKVPAGDATYTAQWEVNQYTVTFDANGGVGGKSVTQDYGTALVAPMVTRTNYTHNGWLPAVPSAVPATNAIYTAQWQCDWHFAPNADGTLMIMGASSTPVGNISIPESIDGYMVVAIGPDAFSGCSSLMGVEIPAGVVSIGSSAFLGCSGLTNLTITGDVRSIGNSAFNGCSALSSITIPNSVTNIGVAAFSGCSGLTHVAIPNGTTSIGDRAFEGCSALEGVTIPSSVTSIGEEAFSGCVGLNSVHIADLTAWCSVSFGSENSNPLTFAHNLYLNDELIADLRIPDGVTSIGGRAFQECYSVTNVIIPESVKTIGKYAFNGCIGLNEIVVPNGVTNIDMGCFARCTNLVCMTLPFVGASRGKNGDVTSVFGHVFGQVMHDGLTETVQAYTYDSNSTTETRYIPTRLKKVAITDETIIPKGAFDNCCNLEEITINEGVTHIAEYAFAHCRGLEDLVVPTSVISIAVCAFSDCNSLKSITLPFIGTEKGSSGKNALFGCVFGTTSYGGGEATRQYYSTSGSVVHYIPTSLRRVRITDESIISYGAFYGCQHLTDIEIDGAATYIGRRVFYGCTSLNNLSIPDSVTSILEYAFYGCSGLESLTIPDGVTNIGASVFYGCSGLTEIAIPDGVTSIGDNSFNGCSGLTHVTIPNSVADIGEHAFDGCDGLSYGEDGFIIVGGWVIGYNDPEVTSLIIPDGVVYIYGGAFADFWDLEKVVFPDTLRYIGGGAFDTCTGLDNVVIPDGVEIIGDGAFRNCTYMRNITIGESVTSIGDEAFAGCTQLSSLSVPDNVTKIGDAAFSNCWRMLSVRLPLGLESVGVNMFSGCTSLTGVTAPTHAFTIKRIFGDRYTAIASVSVSAGETEVCDGAFAGCSALASVAMPNAITNIGNSAFASCAHLSGLELPESLDVIGTGAFSNCTALAAIVLPDGVTAIGQRAFYGCTSLANVTLSRSLASIPDYAFHGCSGLSSMVVPASVGSLGAYIGNYFSSLYYLGNAPSYDANVYASRSRTITTYVVQGSRGWDGIPSSRDLPTSWNGYGITFWEPNRFDATFDANGGTFFDGSTAYACEQITDTGYALPPYEPTLEGFVFDGWWSDPYEGAQIKASVRVNETRDITFYAHWVGKPSSITVRFNPNGGTVEPDEGQYYSTLTYETLPVPTREYYKFAGWWTKAVGGNKVVVSSRVPTADQELFAHWTPETYTIRYNANGGTGSMADQSFVYGSAVVLRANAFSRADKSFAGWAVAADGSVVYPDGGSLGSVAAIENGVINLYAVWRGNSYAVRFDSNGGVGSMDNATFEMDEQRALPVCAFTRDGFDFAGWATSPDGEPVYSDRAVVSALTSEVNGSFVLYAVWRAFTVEVPVVTPGDGSVFVGDSCEVSITCATAGAAIYYSTTGKAPKLTDKNRYTGAFIITNTTTIYAVATRGEAMAYTVVTISKQELTLQYVLGDGGKVGVSTSPDFPWEPVVDNGAAIGYSARSALPAEDDMDSWVELSVVGSGTLSFKCKTSCEWDYTGGCEFDCLMMATNGVEIVGMRLDGIQDNWVDRAVTFSGDGEHKLRIIYHKDESDFDGEDCAWLGDVRWTPAGAAVPIPAVAVDADAATVNAAVDDVGFADASAVKAAIGGSAEEYNAFKSWANGVKGETGDALAGEAAVVANAHAAAAYLLGAERLFENEPTVEIGELAIADGESAGITAMAVAVTVKDGDGAVAVNAARVAAMFEATGDLGDWNGAAKLTPTVTPSGTDASGKMTFVVTPGDGTASKAFLRIKR